MREIKEGKNNTQKERKKKKDHKTNRDNDKQDDELIYEYVDIHTTITTISSSAIENIDKQVHAYIKE